MWNKETQPEVPGTSSSKESRIPGAPMNAPAGPAPAPALPPRALWRAWDQPSW